MKCFQFRFFPLKKGKKAESCLIELKHIFLHNTKEKVLHENMNLN